MSSFRWESRCETRSSPNKTYGTINEDKSNAIVYPTWYCGRHWDNEWLIGEAWRST